MRNGESDIRNNPGRYRSAALVPAALIPFFAAVFYFILFSNTPAGKILYTTAKVFILIWPVVACRYLLRVPFHPLKSIRTSIKGILAGVISGLAISLVITVMTHIPVFDHLLSGAADPIKEKTMAFGLMKYYIPFAIFLSVFHSLMEEYYWRWFLFGFLRKKSPDVIAVIISAIAFSAHHFIVLSQFFSLEWAGFFTLGVAGGGAIWCALYARFQSMTPGWISHILVDLMLMGIGYRLIFV